MTPKRQKRLPSSSSKLEFVENGRRTSSSKRCFRTRSILALGLSVAAITSIVVVIVVWFLPSSNNSADNNGKTDLKCFFSVEAKRVGLDKFLLRLQSEFQKHRPHLIASKFGVTSTEVRKIYRPYDFRPKVLKNVTDTGVLLYNELQSTVFAVVDEQKLKLRERKAMYVAKNILKVVFGWNPFEQNYYSGEWLLGPNIFCWQPACELLYHLENSLPHLKPTSLSDVQRLRMILMEHNSSIRQYNENLKLASRVGMVRSMEACKVGVREFKMRYLPIAISNETGVLKTPVAQILLGKEFLRDLKPEVKEKWTKLYGQTVEEYLNCSLIQNIGRPLNDLIRFLETDYIRHCVPNNVSSGLSSLPLPHVYTDGVVQSYQTTTQELPSGHKLFGTQAYLGLVSVFTSLNISLTELTKMAQERLNGLLSQVISLAQRYTHEENSSKAVSQFKKVLRSRGMFFNEEPFPANESGEPAFLRCTADGTSRNFCPTRWKAMQGWIKDTEKAKKRIRPKLSQLFYTNGTKKTIPDCTIKVAPWYHSEAVYHSYSESRNANCDMNPSLQLLPFFVDNYGPRYTEWTTTAHEQLPGHHLEVRCYIENFRSKCNDVISWLSHPNYFPGFTEGWATYVEYPLLANDTDIYNDTTDNGVLLQKYGMLKYQILAALRTLLDININYYNMTRNEALHLYEKYAWETGDLASKDITRLQSAPGSVTSYMIGQMTFVGARRLMKESLGPRFSLPEFHYQVLRQGEIPLEYLLKYIRDLFNK